MLRWCYTTHLGRRCCCFFFTEDVKKEKRNPTLFCLPEKSKKVEIRFRRSIIVVVGIQAALTPITPYVAPIICRVKNVLSLDLNSRCYKQPIFNLRTDL